MKKKVLNTLVILLLLIVAVKFGYKCFAIAMAGCASLSFLEFFKYKYNNKDIDIVKLISILAILFILFNQVFYDILNILPIIITFLLVVIPVVIYDNNKRYSFNDALYLFGIIVFLSISYSVLILLCKIDVVRCIYVFLIAFMCDIYSYIGTSLVGRHKISNTNRTVEGSIVGVIMASFFGAVYHYNLIDGSILVIIFISFILALASILGDILFYNIKKHLNKDEIKVKVIDSFDSVILVALLYIIIINLI